MGFFGKKAKSEPPAPELPRAREEMLLGDTNRTWTISDFVIHPKLIGLYEEIDRSLQRIFERGSLDPENGNLFDGSIDAAEAVTLNDLNGQYALRPEGINKMVSWRERDVSELRSKAEKHQNNIDQALEELKRYKTRLDMLNYKPGRGGHGNEKIQ